MLRGQFLHQSLDADALCCPHAFYAFVYPLFIYGGCAIQMLGGVENAFFDGWVDFLHHGQQVQAYFVTSVFILQIGAVRYVILPYAVQITDDFFSFQAKQRTYDVPVFGRIPRNPLMPVPRIRFSRRVSTLSSW